MKKLLIAVAILALGGCTTTQLASAPQDVNAAIGAVQTACILTQATCGTASSVAKGGAASTVDNVCKYAAATCLTADTIAAVAKSPTTVSWLNSLGTTAINAATLGSPATPAAQ